MPKELQLWCYGSPSYAFASGTLKYTVFPKERFLRTNCEQHCNYVYWPAVVKIATHF